MKPDGRVFPHTLSNKLRETGTFKLIPSTFALMTVHRHTAASRSTSPASTVQQGAAGGVPTTTPTNSLSSFAHKPSFTASIGQVACVRPKVALPELPP
ncbi:hypothetical protein ACJIZ3_009357 [Penstemon smallii]|uniref:Uncharacterized protein n=1 Tax=Penstemon smallii TaxID=265156 RepID=A0ABD3TCA8_9LAMI